MSKGVGCPKWVWQSWDAELWNVWDAHMFGSMSGNINFIKNLRYIISRYITMIWNYLAHDLIFQVGVNHYTECQVFRNLGRKSSSYNELAFKLAAVVPLRLLIKIKNENPKGFSRLQFLLDSQMNSSSSFFQDDEISTKR